MMAMMHEAAQPRSPLALLAAGVAKSARMTG